MTPIRAIRLKCLDCCCDNPNEVAACPIKDCSLHIYRFGTNPAIKKKEYTEEERRQMRERLAANLAKKNQAENE